MHRKNNVVKDVTVKKPIAIKNFKEDKNMADHYFNWFDRNEFEKILAIIAATNLITRIK